MILLFAVESSMINDPWNQTETQFRSDALRFLRGAKFLVHQLENYVDSLVEAERRGSKRNTQSPRRTSIPRSTQYPRHRTPSPHRTTTYGVHGNKMTWFRLEGSQREQLLMRLEEIEAEYVVGKRDETKSSMELFLIKYLVTCASCLGTFRLLSATI